MCVCCCVNAVVHAQQQTTTNHPSALSLSLSHTHTHAHIQSLSLSLSLSPSLSPLLRIENCLSPEWSHVFRFVYDLGTPTKIAISIFDKSKKGFYRDMGQTQFDVGLIIESMGGTRAKKLKDGGV